MENICHSTIKSVDLDKGEIVINRLNKSQKYDYICRKSFYEKSLSQQEIKKLKEGDEVTFLGIETDKGYYAQELNLTLHKEKKNVCKSTIKSIDLNMGKIIINRLNSQQKKDFLCTKEFYQKSLSTEELSSLSEHDFIEFEYTIKDGNYYAYNLSIIRSRYNEKNIRNNKDFAKNTLNLTKQFIEQLKFNLEYITESADFEDFTFFILKALGISEIYAIPKDNAGGRCDGIFKVSNISNNTPKLEVIYDCTLHCKWEDKKSEQINNYKAQICRNNIVVDYVFVDMHTTKPVKTSILLNNNSEKQIWIITKNKTRVVESGQTEISGEQMSIIVKEVNILDLICILESKLLDTKYIKIDDIADKLKHL